MTDNHTPASFREMRLPLVALGVASFSLVFAATNFATSGAPLALRDEVQSFFAAKPPIPRPFVVTYDRINPSTGEHIACQALVSSDGKTTTITPMWPASSPCPGDAK